MSLKYCQSALSSARIETPASAETPRKNRVYSIHTDAVGQSTPSRRRSASAVSD